MSTEKLSGELFPGEIHRNPKENYQNILTHVVRLVNQKIKTNRNCCERLDCWENRIGKSLMMSLNVWLLFPQDEGPNDSQDIKHYHSEGDAVE
jgi:hypothetical protein